MLLREKFDLATPGSYLVKAQVSATNDENSFNDELEVTVESLVLISTFPYSESFESTDHGWDGELPWAVDPNVVRRMS